MTKRSPAAGGFFLMAAIVGGFVWGLSQGRAMEGVLAGTMIGTIVAVAIWLVDRRKDKG